MLGYLEREIAADLKDISCTPEAMAGVINDLLKLQVLFGDVLAVLPLNLILTDDMVRVQAATPKLLREVLHCSREEVMGKCLSSVLLKLAADTNTNQNTVLAMDGAVLSAMQWGGQIELKNGSHLGVRICPLPLGDEHVSMVLIEPLDKTPAGFWLRQTMYQLQENSELVQRGKEAGGLVHELKNIVQNFSGLVQLVEIETSPKDNIRSRLDMMSEQINTMNGLITAFLQEGRQGIKPVETTLNDVLENTLEMVRSVNTMANIEVISDLDDTLPPLCLDRVRINQVLINCIDNSVDSIKEQRLQDGNFVGKIAVKTYADDERGEVCISIEDNGKGLTPEQEQHVFKPFYTTKRKGNGIGMHFCRTVVRMHGGHIEAHNRPEGGCRVVIGLPLDTHLAESNLNLYDEMAKMDF